MTTTPDEIALMVKEAVKAHGMNSLRSQQQAQQLIGMSELGACRNYLLHMVKQTEPDEEVGIKWPAFIGTWLGDGLENAVRAQFGFLVQQTVEVTLPSGKRLAGTCDVQTDDSVWDFKAVDGLESVKRSGPSFRQKAQIMGYLMALIQAGKLPEDAVAVLVFYDRSGRDDTPYVWMSALDMTVVLEADQRLDDVVYARMYEDEAPRDEPDAWCQVACPFYSKCRGANTDVSGLIEDEGALLAVKNYEEGKRLAREGERLKDEAKQTLRGVSGSTGEHLVRWTEVAETYVEGFNRKAHTKIDIRKMPKGGPPK